jgi:hypothetical protein
MKYILPVLFLFVLAGLSPLQNLQPLQGLSPLGVTRPEKPVIELPVIVKPVIERPDRPVFERPQIIRPVRPVR